jgi:hypothetical protein
MFYAPLLIIILLIVTVYTRLLSSFKIMQLTDHDVIFRACEMGRKEMVKTLLEHNADGRIHPVTKYSPLYIACYNGRKDIVELLLKVSCSLSDFCACHFKVQYVVYLSLPHVGMSGKEACAAGNVR